MFNRTFVLFLMCVLYTFVIIFAIMSEKGREETEGFFRVADIEHIKSYKGVLAGYTIMPMKRRAEL